MQKLTLYSIFSALLLILPGLLFAQDPGGGPDAPIDGGLSILLAAGAAYGVKKYRVRRKELGGMKTEVYPRWNLI